MQRIIWIQINFLTIIDLTLITNNGNITTIGNPLLVDGFKGGFAIDLDGQTQQIESTDDNDCLSDPENCLYAGLTFKISFKLSVLLENMYIFTSGGDLRESRGVSIYYKRKKLCLTVTTTDKEWTVCTKFSKINAFFDFEFSWSIDGLEFFIDGLSVGKRTRYLKRKIKGYRKYKWRFGGPIPTYRGLFAKCTIGTWQIWTASKYIKDAVGVLSGKSTLNRAIAPKYDPTTVRILNSQTVHNQAFFKYIICNLMWWWSSSYDCLIYNYLYNQCLSPPKVVNLNPANGDVYSIQNYMIKFVRDLR